MVRSREDMVFSRCDRGMAESLMEIQRALRANQLYKPCSNLKLLKKALTSAAILSQS